MKNRFGIGQTADMHYIQVEHVTKRYGSGHARVDALQDVSFQVEAGELCVILGSSGAGKTTLLNVLGGMDTVTEGRIRVDGREITAMGRKALVEYRRYFVGFVFQFYNLIPSMTALENVEMASMLVRRSMDPGEALDRVGLTERKGNFPAQLSGGEQQRVSIARAIAKNPSLLLCDEPTGALDDETGKQILELLYDQSRRRHMTVMIITHNQSIAPIADRLIRMKNGRIDSVQINSDPMPVADIRW